MDASAGSGTDKGEHCDRESLCRMVVEVVVEAGEVAIAERCKELVIQYDACGSPSTNVDMAVAGLIQERLAATGLPMEFSGEEIRSPVLHQSGLEVVIDGIDGTRNFRDGNYGWCVSVGVLDRGTPIIGVVHDPTLGDTYYAVVGQGAFLCRRNAPPMPLSVPAAIPPDFSFSIGSFRTGGSTERKDRLTSGVKLLGGRGREWGCVALSICAVARGGLGLFIQSRSILHDHVAALMIAKEAGTTVLEKKTDEPNRSDIAVCHPTLGDSLATLLKDNW